MHLVCLHPFCFIGMAIKPSDIGIVSPTRWVSNSHSSQPLSVYAVNCGLLTPVYKIENPHQKTWWGFNRALIIKYDYLLLGKANREPSLKLADGQRWVIVLRRV